ncbi:MAG: S-adenosylmethionine:tRNA ribosyltransferase-isomerase [Muribaculaceae bacterium]|nr:S-adenosylmethionine:tRNA ribosyltransferase-isomerase [Muribaculaceae bacterium]
MKAKIESIRIEDFDYPLPDERIARHPLARRDACLLIEAAPDGPINHHLFSDLPLLLKPGTLMIANETKVINARMEFFKASGGRIEVFLLEPFSPAEYVKAFDQRHSCIWTCMIGNLKRWKNEVLGKKLLIGDSEVTLYARLLPLEDGETPSASRRVEFYWEKDTVSFAEIVEAAGNIPIPPYLKRDSEASDLEDYQTVYSRVEGSVAAPTAGLHFTPELFERLHDKGIRQSKVTLHVGAGTFQPVKSEQIGDHPMHTESIVVDLPTIRAIISALEEERQVLAVGTTSVRTIESLPMMGFLALNGRDVTDPDAMHVGQWDAYEEDYLKCDTRYLLKGLLRKLEEAGADYLTGSTAIMIAPGFKWRIVREMVTNFHQPQSTLLLLVGSFLGLTPENWKRMRWREIYDEALRGDYRFLSYGDACLFHRKP